MWGPIVPSFASAQKKQFLWRRAIAFARLRSSMNEVTAPPTGRRAAFAFIFITVLMDVLALGVIIPVLPKLVLNFVGGDTPKAAHLTGVFGTIWALMQFLCSPLLGML